MTVRIDSETREALDLIAAALDRDRSYVVNEALEDYIDTHRWQIEHIRRGLSEADAGRFVAPVQMERIVNRLRSK